MTSSFLGGLTDTKYGVPAFNLMALIGLVTFAYFSFVHKENREESGFIKALKKWVMPITIIVVLSTILLVGNSPVEPKVQALQQPATYTTNVIADEAGVTA